MEQTDGLLPHLFRTEYSKITAVLCKLFGIEHVEVAEDIASDTFLLASETWSIKGLPENPAAWLYTVAKNKAKDYLKRNTLFTQKIMHQLDTGELEDKELVINLSDQNITDSQLQMMFAICHPSISGEAQICLSLRILCGFGINEIAAAFLTSKETINKRLFRAKEKLREERVRIEFPNETAINDRLQNVATTLYLLFNEGYYSRGQDSTLQKEVCYEAMRLTYFLIENKWTNLPFINALMSMMCFHASRFEARTDSNGETILYRDQDEALWDQELIIRGIHFLNLASQGNEVSKYHIEAGIAYWHTRKEDSAEKWEHILQLYNQLLMIEYSPIAALNRTYALSKANGKAVAIVEAEKLNLTGNQLYHSLLAELYTSINPMKAISHLQNALDLATSKSDKNIITNKLLAISLLAKG
jgi:RNA polymerase sigma-70 factor (ECF subfamily)